MENIAHGWLEFSPLTHAEALAVESELRPKWKVFTYGWDDSAAVHHRGETLKLSFTARSTCNATWDLLDKIMSEGQGSEVARLLVASKITGGGRQEESQYRAKVTKEPGECKLRRFRR